MIDERISVMAFCSHARFSADRGQTAFCLLHQTSGDRRTINEWYQFYLTKLPEQWYADYLAAVRDRAAATSA
jgi:hypothetical protein